MGRLAPAAIAAGLLVSVQILAMPVRASEPAAGSDTSAPPASSIDWRQSWSATYEAARQRWTKELEPLASDPLRHDRELASRIMALVRALVGRYPDDPNRLAAYSQVAQDLAGLRPDSRAKACLKQLVEEFPGQVGLVTAVLDRVIETMLSDNRRRQGDDGAFAEYAASRVIAIQELGHLAADHRTVWQAWRLRLLLCLEGHRYWDAAQALQRLDEAGGRNDRWLELAAEAHLLAGRPDLAVSFLQEMGERADSRARDLVNVRDARPDFPRDLGLEMKWATVVSRAGGTDTANVQGLLDESADAEGLMMGDGGRPASVWVLADRLLSAQKPEVLAALRQAQQHQAEDLVERARRTGDPQAVVALFRRFPWAASVHEALVAAGQGCLRRGQLGSACRMFEDVLSHSQDVETRAKGQVGLWLAVASESPDPETLRSAFDGIAPDARFPWMGERLSASEICGRLMAGREAEPEPAATLAGLALQTLRVPPVLPWNLVPFQGMLEGALEFPAPLGSVRTDGRLALVAGPNLLACFGEDPSRPLWWRTRGDIQHGVQRRRQRDGGRGDRIFLAAVPGLFQPAMADGRVYARWGLEPTGQALRGLAVFDAATGEILWSTDDDSTWDEMWPVGDPVPADGRVYVLAIQDKVGPITPLHLVCLDGERGTLLWQRTLGSQNPGLVTGDGRQYRPIEMVRYGNAVTVHRGAVYASTNLGFVARCDARDGMVEWISTYPRASMGSNLPAMLRRMGAAPIPAGGRVICLPRDYVGVLALDSRTGKPAWDVPLLPSEEAIGVAGGVMVLLGDDRLLGVDTVSGRVLWERQLAGALCGRPALAGAMVYVGTAEKLVRLDARTGERVEERCWEAADPPQAFALRGGRLLAVSEASAGFERPRPVPAPAADAPALAVPLKRVWSLARPEPQMWLPPPEARMPGMFFLASHGLLEGIRMSAPAGPVWQRFAMSEPEDVVWTEGCMILISDRRVLALDAATGARRWQCEAPWHIGLKRVCPPYLVLARRASDPPQAELAMVDLATGRLVWSRPLDHTARYFRLAAIGSDGPSLHVFGEAWEPGNPRLVEVAVRTADGETTAVRSVLPDDAERPMRIAVGGAAGFCMTEWRTLYEFPLTGGPAVRLPVDLKDLAERDRAELKVVGPWIQINRRNPFPAFRQWILRRGDPKYELRLEREGVIRGGAVYTREGRTITATDLETKKAVAYEIPPASEGEQFRGILDFHAAGDRLWVLSIHPGREAAPAMLALDVFDRATGAPLQSQTLPGVLPAGGRWAWDVGREEGSQSATQIVWADKAVYVTDPRGLQALTPGAPSEIIAYRRYIVPMSARPIAVDAGLEDWDDPAGLPLAGPPERQGRLHLAHDAANLYLAVRYRDRDFLPCVGAQDAAGGDWLEIGLTTNRESHRWAVGLNSRGQVAWEGLGGAALPRGLRGAVRHDPAGGWLTYEVAIPWAGLVQAWGGDARKMGLSVAVWDEDPAGGGSARILTWGEGLGPWHVMPNAHQAIYLYPLTRKAAETMLALVDELPDLPESFDYLLDWSALQGESIAGLADLYADFIRRHPKSITVQRLLTMDRNLRACQHADPGPALLAAARQAAVPDGVLRRYEVESKAYLSQWVYMPPGPYPRSVVLELDDGIRPAPAGWNHRVYWMQPYWTAPRPAFRAYGMFPQGKWHEIRVPLSVLGINQTPLVGISFSQQGQPRLLWDRSAIVYGGQEEVFLEDAPPEGAVTGGTWEWVDSPVRSGKKAHRDGVAAERRDGVNRWVTDFKHPVVLHVGPPPDGPYISQWVYLDPLTPPKSISLGLHDGLSWRGHAIWGAKTVHGRYMGPLPPAGAWQELRLPLEWTPLAAEPVAGICFAQQDGHVLWDRTALVAGGRERAIVEGQLPARPAGGQVEAWAPWADRFHGDARPVPGKVGVAMGCDGRTGYYEAAPSLETDSPEMTVEAWINLRQYPWTGMGRRWVVSKNMNDEYESHYGLLVFRSGVSAIVNIGGTKADAYEVQSDQGLVKLGRWHHVAMTFDSRDLKVYLDGRAVGSLAVNKKRTPGTAPLFIGRRQDGYGHFPGAIDEVRVYDRALAADELRARFEAGGGPPAGEAAASLTGHWGFDDDVVRVDDKAWQWVDYKTRTGKRVHCQPPADGYAAHGCMLREPLVEHLPFDAQATLGALRRHVPNLGPSEEAWRLLGRMAGLDPRPLARAELYRWFLKEIPDHPRALDAAKALADALEDLHRVDPSVEVEARARQLNLPPEALYAYHRQCGCPDRLFLGRWQVLGPLPNPEGAGHDTPYPPETEGIDLAAGYDGAGEKVQWQLHESPMSHVNLKALFGQSEKALAYAVCWVRSDSAQQVALEVGADDACKVWLNRQLVAETKGVNSLVPGSKVVRVNLRAGWNELLVKSDNIGGEWAFIVELVDLAGLGPPKGIQVSPAPPKTP